VTFIRLGREWANARVDERDAIEFGRELEDQPGDDIGVHASMPVAQALLAAEVVDELKLLIAPTIAGSGRRLLDGVPAQWLEPIRRLRSPTGKLLVDYRIIR